LNDVLNRYSYSANNPVVYIDPSGKQIHCASVPSYCNEPSDYYVSAFQVIGQLNKNLNDIVRKSNWNELDVIEKMRIISEVIPEYFTESEKFQEVDRIYEEYYEKINSGNSSEVGMDIMDVRLEEDELLDEKSKQGAFFEYLDDLFVSTNFAEITSLEMKKYVPGIEIYMAGVSVVKRHREFYAFNIFYFDNKAYVVDTRLNLGPMPIKDYFDYIADTMDWPDIDYYSLDYVVDYSTGSDSLFQQIKSDLIKTYTRPTSTNIRLRNQPK